MDQPFFRFRVLRLRHKKYLSVVFNRQSAENGCSGNVNLFVLVGRDIQHRSSVIQFPKYGRYIAGYLPMWWNNDFRTAEKLKCIQNYRLLNISLQKIDFSTAKYARNRATKEVRRKQGFLRVAKERIHF